MTGTSNWNPPAVETCSACNGSGIWHGAFHRGPCDACRGGGMVLADSGDPVPYDDLVPLLKAQLDYQIAQYDRLLNVPGVRQCITDQQERQREHSMYPPGRPPMD